ncbi:hypothetical protein B0T17DRAFT_620495 [Bombardia bombarda]|uniref:Uncharacterized protein n=1 Tax=Bombardia bombarda TaxID=252184 RepID=A0AA39U834_9PEZI|nr:hypothetical protein B0T17DRAFT_620495 [Bombardia bombarda]
MKNAPMGVSEEVMCAVGPSSDVQKWNELRAAKHKSTAEMWVGILRQDHFKQRNKEELDRQLSVASIAPSSHYRRSSLFSLPERRVLAGILGDLMNEDLPEDEIIRRKVDAVNAWVDYAWKIEPKEPTPPQNQMEAQTLSTKAAKQTLQTVVLSSFRSKDVPSRRSQEGVA